MGKGYFGRRDFIKLLGLSSLLMAPQMQVVDIKQNKSNGSLPNILIFVYDALSAKNMSLYGYKRKTTPFIDNLANDALVFHRHYAAGNFTSPSVASFFSGVYPWSHKAYQTYGTLDLSFLEKNIFSLFADRYQTFVYSHNLFVNVFFHQLRPYIDHFVPHEELSLNSLRDFERLSHQDWNVATQAEKLVFWREGFPPTSFFISRFFRQRLELFREKLVKGLGGQFPRGIPNTSLVSFKIEDAIDWLINYLPMQTTPFLGYIHLWPPHAPYATRRDFVDIFDDHWLPPKKPANKFSEGYSGDTLNYYRRLYDEYIAYADYEFNRLFYFIQQENLLKDTIVIFTSDHGEMFERGIWAHNTPTMYEPILHVPLIIWRPDLKKRVDVFEPTSCIDLLPTLQSLSGGMIPDWCQGKILPGFGEKDETIDRPVFAVEAKENHKKGELKKATLVVIKGQYKLIRYIGYDGLNDYYELYDLKRDPEELDNIYILNDPVTLDLKNELEKQIPNGN